MLQGEDRGYRIFYHLTFLNKNLHLKCSIFIIILFHIHERDSLQYNEYLVSTGVGLLYPSVVSFLAALCANFIKRELDINGLKLTCLNICLQLSNNP